jgi:hypothetical protein
LDTLVTLPFPDFDAPLEVQIDFPQPTLTLNLHLKTSSKKMNAFVKFQVPYVQMEVDEPSLEEDLQELMSHCLPLESLICRSKSVPTASFSFQGIFCCPKI